MPIKGHTYLVMIRRTGKEDNQAGLSKEAVSSQVTGNGNKVQHHSHKQERETEKDTYP